MAMTVEGPGVGEWLRSLEAEDRSANTIRSYAGAVQRFVSWYEAEERRRLTPEDLTPVALVGYRNELQHRQGKATASVNAEIAAFRSWCEWLFDHGYQDPGPPLPLLIKNGNGADDGAEASARTKRIATLDAQPSLGLTP